jgi:amidohydrolase
MTINLLPGDWVSDAIKWRHHLHRHPELAYQERQTADFVAARLADFGLRVHRGLGGTGVVGTLSRGGSRRVIGIRADMDALPIEEQSGATHTSMTPGVMHACGHDGHVAIALAAARACAALSDLDGTVHFIFQPAEENEAGGRRMVEDGLFRLFPCDAIYGLHNWPALPVGTCAIADGAMMAALGIFEIELTGMGCHGAMPHQGTDVLLAASHLVTALQGIVSRNVDPQKSGVISVTQLHGGSTWNVIPDTCIIRGTTRWFEEEIGALLTRRLEEVATMIAAGLGCKARIHHEKRMPATINDKAVAGSLKEMVAKTSLGLQLFDMVPSMSSEDFAFMLQEVPGCYIWLGAARPGSTEGLHSPRYDFNDDALPLGAALWIELVRKSLSANI